MGNPMVPCVLLLVYHAFFCHFMLYLSNLSVIVEEI